jgi:enoyl-[acyl-carrier-protein] reductase (NADH)
MTTKTYNEVMRMAKDGTVEVVRFFAVRHGRGNVEVRNTTTGKRKTWQVEQVPDDFQG